MGSKCQLVFCVDVVVFTPPPKGLLVRFYLHGSSSLIVMIWGRPGSLRLSNADAVCLRYTAKPAHGQRAPSIYALVTVCPRCGPISSDQVSWVDAQCLAKFISTVDAFTLEIIKSTLLAFQPGFFSKALVTPSEAPEFELDFFNI